VPTSETPAGNAPPDKKREQSEAQDVERPPQHPSEVELADSPLR
jgi:hypothetical protein